MVCLAEERGHDRQVCGVREDRAERDGTRLDGWEVLGCGEASGVSESFVRMWVLVMGRWGGGGGRTKNSFLGWVCFVLV